MKRLLIPAGPVPGGGPQEGPSRDGDPHPNGDHAAAAVNGGRRPTRTSTPASLLPLLSLGLLLALSLSGCTSTSANYLNKKCTMKVEVEKNALVEATLQCAGTRGDLLQLDSDNSDGESGGGGFADHRGVSSARLDRSSRRRPQSHPISTDKVLHGCRVKSADDVECPIGETLDPEAMKSLQVECRSEYNDQVRRLCVKGGGTKGKSFKEGSGDDYVADENMAGVSLLLKRRGRSPPSLAAFFQRKA